MGWQHNMKVILASYYFRKEINPEFVQSMVYLTAILNELKIEYDYFISEKQEIDRAKNKFVNDFLDMGFTHFFMISPELSWDKRGMVRLLNDVIKNEKIELIGGIYPQKGIYRANIKTEDGYIKGYDTDKFRILEAEFINSEFTIYSRSAFEKVIPFVDKYKIINDIGKEEEKIEFFKCTNNIPGTEDVYFQKKFIEAGGMTLVEPNITFGYTGKRKWSGNYTQYLLGVEPV
jgi:hypothetical protein